MKMFTRVSLSLLPLLALALASCETLQQNGRTYTVTAADGSRQQIVVGKKTSYQAKAAETAASADASLGAATATDIKESSDNEAPDSTAIAGDWTIHSVRGNLVTAEDRPYFTFDLSASRFYASNGCNILNGDVILGPRRSIRFDHTVATLKMCADAPYEFLINLAINDVRSYSLRHTGAASFIDLKNQQGQTILTLRRHNMEFLNGAWRVTGINGQHVDTQPTIVIDIPEMKIHGKGACNTFNGNLFIDPDKDRSMQFQNIVSTRMSCPDIDLESHYFLALEAVESASLQPDGTVVMYDASHSPILTLTPLKLK